MPILPRKQYTDMFGPTVGDRFHLADTNLVVEVEKDYSEGLYGDEVVYGGGKTMRDGMASDPQATAAQGALDTVITNVVVIDPVVGVVKCDIGIKDGFIVGIGKSGNPQTQNNVDPDLVIGPGTEAIAGEHLIATAGAIDSHVHLIAPQQAEQALTNGITTLIGGGTGPTDGSNGTTCTPPGPYNIGLLLQAAETLPVNLGIMGKGNGSLPGAGGAGPRRCLRAQGARGLGAPPPAVIDNALNVADEHDVQVAIHTDSLNEGGFFEDTRSAIDGRAIHTFHSEARAAATPPDILRVTGEPNVLPSSTNPTLPYTKNSVDELLDMVMVCHHLSRDIPPEDVSFADSRVRAETIAAESVLHDLGVISMFSSDSQAMGRIGESVTRAFQTAHHCKDKLGGAGGRLGAQRQPAGAALPRQAHHQPRHRHGHLRLRGLDREGQARRHRALAHPLLRRQAKMVIKGGLVSWAQMGDPQRLAPDPAAGHLPADVRAVRQGAPGHPRHVHVAGGYRGRRAGAARTGPQGPARAPYPHHRQAQHGPQRRAAGRPGRPGDVQGHAQRQGRHHRPGEKLP